MDASPAADDAFEKTPVRRSWPTVRRWSARWRKRAAAAKRKLVAVPLPVRIAVAPAAVLAILTVANLVYHVAHKPTEMLFPVSGSFNKTPAGTWRQYGPLFREYSTGAIRPELLAALAQIESTGNPLARTYWRWRLTWNPFAIYAPASSAVGMYQMTDPAFAEARRYCVRRHAVVQDGCGFTSLYIRVVPSHAVELAAVYLDRNVAAVLSRQPNLTATAQQKQDLAALIHLCGAGPARAYARRGFRVLAGERCGDHLVGAYLAKVNATKQQFARLAADRT
jgi:hypothetical protein